MTKTQTSQPLQSWWHKSSFLEDYETRRKLAKTLKGFCLVYLSHYMNIAPADFHAELLDILGDSEEKMIEILGFRGSAKSPFGSLALPLWAALEYPKLYPFIIAVADTTIQSGTNIFNIKTELEDNILIKLDYGEITGDVIDEWTLEGEEEWQSKNMLLSTGVRILARSRGQKVRGLRHKQHRPKLVIVDDPEDLEWVRNKENRDKTERWLRGEVIPAIDEKSGRLIVIGNQLYTDALMSRLKKDKTFKHLEYPLVRADGSCSWKAKYPTQATLDLQRDKVGVNAYLREYCLKVVPDEGQEVKPEEIYYYDALPKPGEIGMIGTGVDYAISKKETADYTSMVSGALSYENERPHIDIYPNAINERFDMQETVGAALALHHTFGGNHIIFAEEVAYQKAANDEMERKGLAVERMQAMHDKRARLRVAAVYIKNGTVRFPRAGCEDLLLQLFGFGVEEHDDMVDALVYLILGLVNQGIQMPEEIIAI
jgi:hypothetical protein